VYGLQCIVEMIQSVFGDSTDFCLIMDVLGLTRPSIGTGLCIGGKLRRATGRITSCGTFDVARNMKDIVGLVPD
jgi:hypothetical protein